MARWIKRCYVSLYNELLRNKVDYISNNFESFGALKARLENKEANIYKINNDFFVFNKYPRLLIFFVDSPKKIKLPKCYIKITKHDEKVQKFLFPLHSEMYITKRLLCNELELFLFYPVHISHQSFFLIF